MLAYFERSGDVPMVVAANGLDEGSETELRKELEIDDDVPIVFCDVKERASSKRAVVELLRLSKDRVTEQVG